MGETQRALGWATLSLLLLACDSTKSKSLSEDGASAGSPATAGTSSSGSVDGGTGGRADRSDRGGSSGGGRADTGGSESTGGSAGGGAGGAEDSAGTVGAGARPEAGGTVGSGGTTGAGARPATGGGGGRDAGPDGDADAGIAPAQAGAGGVGPEGGAEAGAPPACTGTRRLGNLMPIDQTVRFAQSMVLGDLNGDGQLDIVSPDAALSSKAVSALLGRGNGRFTPKAHTEADAQPEQVALGDLNGDGRLDLLAASYGGTTDAPNVLDVWLGNGDGTFGDTQAYSTADGPQALVLGDLDADGHLDVVTADQWADQVSVFLGKGDGTLSARRDYATGVGPSALALGDVNADGSLDLVVAATGTRSATSSSVSVLLGKGDGTFGDAADFVLDVEASYLRASLALADLDGDDALDIVAATSWGPAAHLGSASLLMGNGDGTFALPASLPNVDSPTSVRLLDVNEDAELDLVFALQDRVSILYGRGDGSFPTRAEYSTGGILRTLDLGDLNNDGELDLALAFDNAFSRGGLGVLFGSAGGTFASPTLLPTPGYPDSIAVGDIDADGKLDIATANSAVDSVSVLLGEGNGGFAAREDYTTGEGPTFLALGDMDGDGRADIVTLNSSAETVSVLRGTGEGILAAKVDSPVAALPASAALGDVNGDTKLDIVTTNSASEFYDNGTVNVMLGTGDGTFAAPVDSFAGAHPTSLALGDLNGDGKLDVVVANQGAGDMVVWSVGVLLGNGDGTFAVSADASTDRAGWVALADLNGDGKLDLVMAFDSGPELRVMLGNGDGSFAASESYPTWDYVRSISFGDMDGDGQLDIVAASDTIDLLSGKGDGTFGSRVSYAVGPGAVALGDLDGDGSLDVAAATHPSAVSVLLNSCR
jgi:hypothetical protein